MSLEYFDGNLVPREKLDSSIRRLNFIIDVAAKQSDQIESLKEQARIDVTNLFNLETKYGLALDEIQRLERLVEDLKRMTPIYVYDPNIVTFKSSVWFE